MGIDVGSTTIKVTVLNSRNSIVFSNYQRHFSNIREVLRNVLTKAKEQFIDSECFVAVTGSGGLLVSKWLNVPFIQEVVAASEAVLMTAPDTDVAIELGGEDAKIIYFTGGLEQRMNGICAGGTGSFIDQMASLLQTDAAGLNDLAKDFAVLYPIAARCGVFAKTDIQPLINQGADKKDLAASIFQAVVSQTISGLACGKPIKGNVAFLGGPLHFLSELRNRFIDVLNLKEAQTIIPENSHLFAALGCAKLAVETALPFRELLHRLSQNYEAETEIERLPRLFEDEKEYKEFKERHNKHQIKKRDLDSYRGGAFLGIDAGSTTTKLALISEDGSLLYSVYKSNEGNPLKVVIESLKQIYINLPESVRINRACVTGYGEDLIKAALKVDMGEIETVAHYRAAKFFVPDVDFILDIGGQDMKCIRIKKGSIDNVLLNEACSSGCGSFIETFANSLGYSSKEFSRLAIASQNPIDLGSRCTVFMNSRVKQAQKEGSKVEDISAGLAWSVIKNALYKVIKITDTEEIGENIVVQGGTFYNDAVLKSFEMILQKKAARPDIAGLMGALGAALIAQDAYKLQPSNSDLISLEELGSLVVENKLTRCNACTNNCLLTVNSFAHGRKFISGNRCEKAFGGDLKKEYLPDLFIYKYKRVFDYKPLEKNVAIRGEIGIPRVLNMYENYPFWHTFFTDLGYRVVLSPESSREVYEEGIESIPSESVCYPAKLVHGHVTHLIRQGIKRIFYPGISYEIKEHSLAQDCYNCPIVISYPENIKNNVEEIRENNINFMNPFLSFSNKKGLIKRLANEFDYLPYVEVVDAAEKAWKEQERFRKDIRNKGRETLDYIEQNNIPAIVLAGRPYHIDPEINHGINRMITGYGFAVLTEDSVFEQGYNIMNTRPLGIRDQWTYHSRLYSAAGFAATKDNIEIIQLNSFGCGIDALTCDEVREITESASKIYTSLKIDEVSNLGSARIRIRSLIAALKERRANNYKHTEIKLNIRRVVYTKDMNKDYTLLIPQMAPIHFELLKEAFYYSGYNVKLLPAKDKKAIETGLKYVNNDSCYPALIVVGQVLNAIKSGEYNVNKLAVLMSQTGGGCRASNYIALIRKALKKAGYPQIPVVSVSASGIEKNPGFTYSPKMLIRMLQACVYGDMLMRLLYRVRPYERIKGSANILFNKWLNICKASLENASRSEFKENIYNAVSEFDNLQIDFKAKPRVGIVGEILVKFHPTANNDIVSLVEEEGAEAVVPDLLDFFFYGLHNKTPKAKYLSGNKYMKTLCNITIDLMDFYRKPLVKALKASERFSPPVHIRKLAEMAQDIVSTCNQTGEGWFLTAEMLELINSGAGNIICMQPFACLPNHVTGKGVIKELKRKYPLSNIVAVDYDPGASEVNQLNRIKLMLAQAFKNMPHTDGVQEEADYNIERVWEGKEKSLQF